MTYDIYSTMRHKKHHFRLISLLLVGVILAYPLAAWKHGASQSLPPIQTLSRLDTVSATAALAWPSYGQSAVGAGGYGLLSIHNAQTPVPTASTAKIMTAYAVLKVKPLALGQQTSPVLTMTQADVDIYNDFYANDGSVIAITNGEQLSEYQALQALMLPSANNIADSLAIWAFGSTADYVAYANDLAEGMGMTDTHFDDASGFSAQTVSTAQDMVRLTLAAMKDPVFAQIVGQSTATLPVAGTVRNVNGLLGRDNIVGVKTGNTEEAGGCFVAAATHQVGDKTITVVTAIMAAPNLTASLTDSLPLLASAKANFVRQTVLPKGTTVGYYAPTWTTKRTPIKTSEDLQLVQWKGSRTMLDVGIKTASTPLPAHSNVGTIYVHATGTQDSTAVRTDTALPSPGFSWRLGHLF
jgi:D-alanyl-D-alanine carboxypeptidase (penicillin-binding protein 5/6)